MEYLTRAKEYFETHLAPSGWCPIGATEAEVDELEERVGLRLPGAYREFLLWMGRDEWGFLCTNQEESWMLNDVEGAWHLATKRLARWRVLPHDCRRTFRYCCWLGEVDHWFDLPYEQEDPLVYQFSERAPEEEIRCLGRLSHHLYHTLRNWYAHWDSEDVTRHRWAWRRHRKGLPQRPRKDWYEPRVPLPVLRAMRERLGEVGGVNLTLRAEGVNDGVLGALSAGLARELAEQTSLRALQGYFRRTFVEASRAESWPDLRTRWHSLTEEDRALFGRFREEAAGALGRYQTVAYCRITYQDGRAEQWFAVSGGGAPGIGPPEHRLLAVPEVEMPRSLDPELILAERLLTMPALKTIYRYHEEVTRLELVAERWLNETTLHVLRLLEAAGPGLLLTLRTGGR